MMDTVCGRLFPLMKCAIYLPVIYRYAHGYIQNVINGGVNKQKLFVRTVGHFYVKNLINIRCLNMFGYCQQLNMDTFNFRIYVNVISFTGECYVPHFNTHLNLQQLTNIQCVGGKIIRNNMLCEIFLKHGGFTWSFQINNHLLRSLIMS